jgi:hypothetical protein
LSLYKKSLSLIFFLISPFFLFYILWIDTLYIQQNHYLTLSTIYNKRKKIYWKKIHKKKKNKKLSSNYIKVKIVCKYARKNKSSKKNEKENTSKSFCLTSLSLNTISLSKVKKMYQKSYPTSVNLHWQKNPRTKNSLFVPPMLSKIKNLYIHFIRFLRFFFQLVHLQFILSKNSLKKLIYIKSNKFVKRKEVKDPSKSFLSNTQSKKKDVSSNWLKFKYFLRKKSTKNPSKSFRLTL